MNCMITGNPCGTDTWAVGEPCVCQTCLKWLSDSQVDMPQEAQEVIDKHFWEIL